MSEITLVQQSGWAGQLLAALEDTVTSTGSVIGWLQSNLGQLNIFIKTDFTLSGDSITPEMTSIQSGIYNEMYFCSWLAKKARSMVGSMTYDWIEMEGDGQGHVRRVSNTQKATTYQSLTKDCEIKLKELIKQYNGGNYSIPRQITFNHRHSADAGLCCSDFCWSANNPCLY